jgi:hypothetical protein
MEYLAELRYQLSLSLLCSLFVLAALVRVNFPLVKTHAV